MLNLLRGGAVLVLGYMLSPLSWWNDLFFNLPIAYGFGWLFGLIQESWLIPATLLGYWLSNVLGIVMMQFGAGDLLQKQPQQRHLKRDLVIGIASSTAYTVVILALIRFTDLDITAAFPIDPHG